MAVDEDPNALTVQVLKERLKSHGLSTSGKKAELVDRLRKALAEEATPVQAKDQEAIHTEDKQEDATQEDSKQEKPKDEEVADAGEDVEMKADGTEETPQEPEELKELEQDAPQDQRKKNDVKAVMGAMAADATLNVMTTSEGKVLTSLTEGGFQHLVASARSSVGVKSGRYLYEVRIVETRSYADTGKNKVRQSCCLGFSTAGSSLFLGDGAENVGFDSDGHFVSAGKWSENALCKKFVPYCSVYGVLLNLDQKSPNANTVSLFCDGIRISKPQPLPEGLKGKSLFPTVNYKGMTLHVNLGPCCIAPLPFRCTMLQEAAACDVTNSAITSSTSGQCQVVFPVGLPEEGTFEWLDGFLKDHPNFIEISNRAILDWGLKSGLFQQQHGNWQSCNDRPAMDFGIREIDDYSFLKTIHSFAPMLKRDYVVMEVKNNLLTEGRASALASFSGDEFKKVALVVMGEPPKSFKEKAHAQTLEEKKKQVASEVRRKKTMEAAEKRREKKRKEAEQKKEEEKKEEKEEGEKEEADKEGEKVEQQTEELEDAESIEDAIKKATDAVELTEQEKSAWFPKPAREDLAKKDLCRCFSSFSIPDKDEGFDEVNFEWSKRDQAGAYLKSWMVEKKLTQRVEDLQPGARFKEQFAEWTRQLQEWRKRYSERRSAAQHKPAPKKRKVGEEAHEGDGEDGDSKEKDKENGEEQEGTPMQTEATIRAEDVDPCTLEDIDDIGNGNPLYMNFTWEDWMMLALRFELHLLVYCFKLDVNDVERPSFHESHLPFYYYKYFKKQLNVKHFGVESNVELIKLVEDTVEVSPQKAILEPQLSEDTPLEIFIRLTEDHRRERQQRFDAGDETAALKLQRPPPRQQQQQQWGRTPWEGGKGRDEYRNRGNEYPNRPPPPSYGYGSRDENYKGGGYKGSRGNPPAIGQPVRKGGPPGGRDDGRNDGRGRDQGFRDGNRDARGASGGYGGYNRDGGNYPRDGRGPPPAARSRSPPAPPAARGAAPPAPSTYGGGQRRNYAPPTSSSSGGGYNNQGYNKPRASYGSGGPSPSRGGGGGGGYGGQSYGASGGYRR